LTAESTVRHGGYYCEREFDVGTLLKSGRRLLEIGRSCVHREYRNGATIALLWFGIATYLMQSRHDAVIACASISLRGQLPQGIALANRLALQHLSTSDLRVTPRNALPPPVDKLALDAPMAVPPLIKGYLRSGAVVCGAPHWDKDLDTADLLMFLAVERVEVRYARHFLGYSTNER
jgi:putative hemolysin